MHFLQIEERPFQCVPFLKGENISLRGIDLHKKYCLGIIEGNNTETKLRFPIIQNDGKHSLKMKNIQIR